MEQFPTMEDEDEEQAAKAIFHQEAADHVRTPSDSWLLFYSISNIRANQSPHSK